MDARQDLRQVAVPLVGHDEGGAGLRDEDVGAGDADIGGKEAVAQHGARLGKQACRVRQVAVFGKLRVDAAEHPPPPGRGSHARPGR